MDCARLGSVVVLVGIAATPASARAQRTVFLNLESQAITNGPGNDPSTNAFSSADFLGGTIDGWGALGEDDRAELMWWFKEAGVPFDLHFTYERPAVGTYDMLVFGTEADAAELFDGLGCSTAVGLQDCNDADLETISFLFWGCLDATQQTEMSRVAFTGLTALGFGWGLENLTSSGQIMAGYNMSGVEFGDECTPISGTSACAHQGCMMGQQNSTADLLPRLGARVDDGPPVVAITAPPNLSVTASDVTVSADVTDEFGGLAVQLEILEAKMLLEDPMPPYSWFLGGVPDGMWTARVTAVDADMNMVTQDVVFCVGVQDCGEVGASESSTTAADTSSTGGESSSSGDESTTGDETSSGGADTGTIPPPMTTTDPTAGFGRGGAETGCGCTSDRGGLGWWSLAFGAMALARRRGSRR